MLVGNLPAIACPHMHISSALLHGLAGPQDLAYTLVGTGIVVKVGPNRALFQGTNTGPNTTAGGRSNSGL